MIRTTRGLHIPSSELHAIAPEISPTDFRMLPSIRFDPSNTVGMASMKLIWTREKPWRMEEHGTMTYPIEARPMRTAKSESSIHRSTMEKLAFTIAEASQVSSLGQTSIYKAIREQLLKARKYGTRTVIIRTDLVSFLDNLPVEYLKPVGGNKKPGAEPGPDR